MPVHPVAIFGATGDFTAWNAAEAACEQAGFSVGPMCRGSSSGIVFGRADIGKWRTLSRAEIARLHGQIFGGRVAPVTVMLHADAPVRAADAFAQVLAAAQRETLDA